MKYFFLLTIVVTGLLSSCELNVKTDKTQKERPDSKIRNGIVIKSTGVKVDQAFLLFDDGALVPETNTVKINQKVKLRLITSGWSEKSGRIFLSARETVETNEGDIVLDEKDLFHDFEDGLSVEESQFITLSVVITEINKLYDYFKVSFQVKDINETGNMVKGHYKLYIN